MATSSTSLKLIIDLVNNTDSKFKEIGKNFDEMQKRTENVRNVLQKTAVAAGVAFAAVGAEMYAAIQAANEAQKVEAQLNAVIKSTGSAAGVTADQVLKLSSALQKQTTYSDEAITSAQNMLLTFTNIKDNVFPDATQAILDMSTAMGTDLTNTAIQVGKALNDPVRGVTALQRVGVRLTDTQKALVEQLVAAGDTMGAQKIILAELAKEFGGSAAAQAQTFAGRVQQLKNRLDDMQEGIGRALIPMIERLVEVVGPVVDKIITWIEQNPQLTATILVVVAALSGMVLVVSTLGIALIGLTSVAAAFGVTLGVLLGWMILIPVAIAAVIALGIALYMNWEKVQAFGLTVWNGIRDLISNTMTAISSAFQTAMNTVQSIATTIWEAIKNVFWTAVNFIIGLWAMLLDFLVPGWDVALMQLWNTAVLIFESIKNTIIEAFTAIGSFTQSAMAKISSIWNTAWGAIRDAFVTIWNVIKSVAKEAFDFIKSGIDALLGPLQKIIDMANAALNAAKAAISAAGNLVGGAVNSVLGRGSQITGRASGGPVSPTSTYWVGEKGPELFSPQTYGRISAAGTGMGGITLVVSGNTIMGREGVAQIIGKELLDMVKQNIKIG